MDLRTKTDAPSVDEILERLDAARIDDEEARAGWERYWQAERCKREALRRMERNIARMRRHTRFWPLSLIFLRP